MVAARQQALHGAVRFRSGRPGDVCVCVAWQLWANDGAGDLVVGAGRSPSSLRLPQQASTPRHAFQWLPAAQAQRRQAPVASLARPRQGRQADTDSIGINSLCGDVPKAVVILILEM